MEKNVSVMMIFDTLSVFEVFFGLGIVFSLVLIVVTIPFSVRVRKRGYVTARDYRRTRIVAAILAFFTVLFYELAVFANSEEFGVSFSTLQSSWITTTLCLTPCPGVFAIWFVWVALRSPIVVDE